MTQLAVSEIFGPTVQGEGASLGRPCIFLRTAACNLACVWCDTKYTWDWEHYDKEAEVTKMAPDQVAAAIEALVPAGWPHPMLVISGGEPMLQQDALAAVVTELAYRRGWRVEVETAGTKAPIPALNLFVQRYTVSLKLAHSGNLLAKRRREDAILALRRTGAAVWKFVAQQPSDLDEVEELVKAYHLYPVYIMPEGVTHEAVTQHAQALAPHVIARGWSLTPRYHVDLWGAKRGV